MWTVWIVEWDYTKKRFWLYHLIHAIQTGSDDEYSDDDDMSWKVRRAAAKCLDAVVSTRHEMLPEFYRTVSPALIARFKEREENVKADVFHAYLSLLKQTRPAQSWLCDPDAMEQGETPLTMLQIQVGKAFYFFFLIFFLI